MFGLPMVKHKTMWIETPTLFIVHHFQSCSAFLLSVSVCLVLPAKSENLTVKRFSLKQFLSVVISSYTFITWIKLVFQHGAKLPNNPRDYSGASALARQRSSIAKEIWYPIRPKNFGSDVIVTWPYVRTSVRPSVRTRGLTNTLHTLDRTLCWIPCVFGAKSHVDPRCSKTSKDNKSQKQIC